MNQNLHSQIQIMNIFTFCVINGYEDKGRGKSFEENIGIFDK